MIKRFISKLILVSYLHQIIFTSVVFANWLEVKPLEKDYGFSIELKDQENHFSNKVDFSPLKEIPAQELSKKLGGNFEKISEGITWEKDGVVCEFDWLGNLTISKKQDSLSKIIDHKFVNHKGSIKIKDGLRFRNLELEAKNVFNYGNGLWVDNLKISKDSNFVNFGTAFINNGNLYNLVNQRDLKAYNLDLNGGNFVNSGNLICDQKASFKDIDTFNNNTDGNFIASDFLELQVNSFNNAGIFNASKGFQTTSFKNLANARSEIYQLELYNIDKKFINQGSLKLKNLIALGRAEQNIENFGILEITDSGWVSEKDEIGDPFQKKGFRFGDVENQKHSTIGFGSGTYHTGIFTNHGIRVVLDGQKLVMSDQINHGEIHCKSDYTIKGVFKKLGKVRVNGSLILETHKGENLYDQLKDSDIKASNKIIAKSDLFAVNGDLNLWGSWQFNVEKFVQNKDLIFNPLTINKDKILKDVSFYVSDSFVTSGDVNNYSNLVTNGRLNIKAKTFHNKFGYIYSKDFLNITAEEDFINGLKSEASKIVEGGESLYSLMGAIIGSDEKIDLATLKGSLFNNYGMIWTRKDLSLNASETIKNLSGVIKAGDNTKIKSKKFILTRDEPYNWTTGGCGGHRESRAWGTKHVVRHCGGGCNPIRHHSKETSQEAIIDITNETGNEGDGSLDFDCSDVDVIASSIYAEGDIRHLAKKIADRNGATNSFVVRDRNGKAAKIKTGQNITVSTDSVRFEGSADALNMTIDADKVLLKFTGNLAKTGRRITIDMKPYLEKAYLKFKILKKKADDTFELAIPLGKTYDEKSIGRVFVGKNPDPNLELRPYVSHEVLELAVRLASMDIIKASRLDRSLYLSLHSQAEELKKKYNLGKNEALTEKQLQDCIENELSFLVYKVADAVKEDGTGRYQIVEPAQLSISTQDQDNLRSGEIRVQNNFTANAKEEFRVHSGVISAHKNHIKSKIIEFKTTTTRHRNGAGYVDTFDPQATLSGSTNIVRASDTFSSSGALFESEILGYYKAPKQVIDCAIAHRLDIVTGRYGTRNFVRYVHSQQGKSSCFISNGELRFLGDEILHKGIKVSADTVTFDARNLNVTADRLTHFTTESVHKKRGLFSSGSTSTSSSRVIELIASEFHARELNLRGENHNFQAGRFGVENLHNRVSNSVSFVDQYAQNQFHQETRISNPLSTSVSGANTTQDIKKSTKFYGTTIIKYNPSKMLFEGAENVKNLILRDAKGKQLLEGRDYEIIPEKTLRTDTTTYSRSSQVIPTPVVIIGGMIAAYFSGGVFGNVIGDSAMAFVAQKATTVMMSTGSVKSVLDSFNNDQCIKDLAITVAGAGIGQGINKLTVPNGDWSKYVKPTLNTLNKPILKTLVNGERFGKALADQVKDDFIVGLGASGAQQIGKFYQAKEINYLSHKLLHGINGAFLGQFLAKDPITGAIGAIGGEVFMETRKPIIEERAKQLMLDGLDDEALYEARALIIEDQVKIGKITAAVGAAILNRDVNLAALVAGVAMENNSVPSLMLELQGFEEGYRLAQVFAQKGYKGALDYLAQGGLIKVVYRDNKVGWLVGDHFYSDPKEAWGACVITYPNAFGIANDLIKVVNHQTEQFNQVVKKFTDALQEAEDDKEDHFLGKLKNALIAMEVSEEGNKAVGKLARQSEKEERKKEERARQNYLRKEKVLVDNALGMYKSHHGRSPSPNTRKQIIIGAEFEHAEHEASRETLRYVPFCNALNTTLDLLTGDITWGEATWEFTKDVTCVAVANKWLKKASEVSTAFKKVRNAKNIAKVEGVSRPSTLVTADSFGKNSKIIPLEKSGRIMFDGVEFRAVRDLRHVSDEHLLKMFKTGANPYDLKGRKLVYHHIEQIPQREVGASYAQLLGENHNIWNKVQHPKGNLRGSGLTVQERQDSDKLVRQFNKEIAKIELVKRGKL